MQRWFENLSIIQSFGDSLPAYAVQPDFLNKGIF